MKLNILNGYSIQKIPLKRKIGYIICYLFPQVYRMVISLIQKLSIS